MLGRTLPDKCLSESYQSMIHLIVAINRKNAIGFRNRLLYWLPNDLKRFKALTTGHTIVMGRKTFESLPKGALPYRRNIVISRQALTLEGAEVFHSLEAAVDDARKKGEEVYIIGGASIYEAALPIADRLCITLVDDEAAEADTYFPEISPDEWEAVMEEHHPADEKHAYRYTFIDYERRGT